MKTLELAQSGIPTVDRLSRIQGFVERVISAWPTDVPLFALCSGAGLTRWSRWTILAQPRAIVRHDGGKTVLQRVDSFRRKGGDDGLADLGAFGHDPVADLAQILKYQGFSSIAVNSMVLPDCLERPASGTLPAPPFAGGWIGWISYDLGARLEPTAVYSQAANGAVDGSAFPLFEFAWCADGIVIDHESGRCFEFGKAPIPFEDLCANQTTSRTLPDSDRFVDDYALSAFRPEQARGEVEEAVARAIEYIRAGDIFQANISQRFRAEFHGSSRGLFAAAYRRSPAWYMAYLEIGDERSLLSLSPELFLSFDERTRQVLTRPMKGTAPIESPAADLGASAKDEAELNMIVDLMRNDLGRVCEFGSVKVIEDRIIESHSTVHHGVSTIEGTVRAEKNLMDLLRATLPGGSITGAPKIRAMQIIDKLEPFKRGPFFGSIGFVSPATGQARFNLAIRTMLIEGSRATYIAGAGIVADSDPALEYEEMILKTKAALFLKHS